ncbi:MAG: phosphopyruvate hydratase [Clostridia bacterium]|nr:phosphopyruvate hydratase [Clostridia bacterium]
MLCGNKIAQVKAREILDSRGNPTLEATVVLEDGSFGVAASPSGASTGKYEAHELRDIDESRYGGKGVLKAVENVNGKIARSLVGTVCNQGMVDCIMIREDDTPNKSRLGANATLAVSLAAAKAGAMHSKVPLYRYVGGVGAQRIPTPMMNILNGGAHASNSLDFQEFMIVPVGFGTFYEALRGGCEIYHTLGRILKSDGKTSTVGDEGGFAPDLKDESEALDYIVTAIDKAGYSTHDVKIALDCAASEWADGDGYILPKARLRATSDELIAKLESLAKKYPIVSVEDGLGEDDTCGWRHMTDRLGGKLMLVGDDLFVTNPKKLREGIREGLGNSVLVKPNQIGTLSETLQVTHLASLNGYRQILSHRSGETCDTSIADIAVATNCGFIKTGAPCRSERTAKYNRLLKIEAELGGYAVFGDNI